MKDYTAHASLLGVELRSDDKTRALTFRTAHSHDDVNLYVRELSLATEQMNTRVASVVESFTDADYAQDVEIAEYDGLPNLLALPLEDFTPEPRTRNELTLTLHGIVETKEVFGTRGYRARGQSFADYSSETLRILRS